MTDKATPAMTEARLRELLDAVRYSDFPHEADEATAEIVAALVSKPSTVKEPRVVPCELCGCGTPGIYCAPSAKVAVELLRRWRDEARGRDLYDKTNDFINAAPQVKNVIGTLAASQPDTPAAAAPAAPSAGAGMVKVDQTVIGPAGNCQSACLAMLLGWPLAEVPNFLELPGADQDDEVSFKAQQTWLNARGWGLVTIAARGPFFKRHFSKGYVLVGGKSPRGLPHAVIYKDGELWHDPHPSREGVAEIEEVDILYPLNPAAQSVPSSAPLTGETPITASEVKQADAMPAVHQGQETEASGHAAPSETPSAILRGIARNTFHVTKQLNAAADQVDQIERELATANNAFLAVEQCNLTMQDEIATLKSTAQQVTKDGEAASPVPAAAAPSEPCQHAQLTWDIFFGKGFCLDCGAKIRAWHGELSMRRDAASHGVLPECMVDRQEPCAAYQQLEQELAEEKRHPHDALTNAAPQGAVTVPYQDGILSEEWLAAVERGDCTTTDCEVLVGELRRLASELAHANSLEGRTCSEDGCQNLAQWCDGHRAAPQATVAEPESNSVAVSAPAAAAPSEIPAPPPGIVLLSVDEFLNRAAPSETPRTELLARLNDMAHRTRRHNYDIGDYWNIVEEAADVIEQLGRDLHAAGDGDTWEAAYRRVNEALQKCESNLGLALDHIEKDDKELERLHEELEKCQAEVRSATVKECAKVALCGPQTITHKDTKWPDEWRDPHHHLSYAERRGQNMMAEHIFKEIQALDHEGYTAAKSNQSANVSVPREWVERLANTPIRSHRAAEDFARVQCEAIRLLQPDTSSTGSSDVEMSDKSKDDAAEARVLDHEEKA